MAPLDHRMLATTLVSRVIQGEEAGDEKAMRISGKAPAIPLRGLDPASIDVQAVPDPVASRRKHHDDDAH
jgi:hypothetical protein